MTTKIIKAWINGAIQEIEVEDIISPAQPLSVEDRLLELEDKPIITDGNLLVGNGTDEPEEMTPDEALSHINGVSISTMTTDEYEELETTGATNANILYMLSDAEEETPYVVSDIAPDDTSVFWVDTTDNTGDYEQVVVDSTLTQSGWAADAKKTGDTINTITVQLNNMTTKLNNMIYVGRTAPINAVDGMVWVDTSESQSINNEVN
jgi:hypothetical protein